MATVGKLEIKETLRQADPRLHCLMKGAILVHLSLIQREVSSS